MTATVIATGKATKQSRTSEAPWAVRTRLTSAVCP